MEVIAGILGMIICWQGRAYKEARFIFVFFALQIVTFLYSFIFVKLFIPYVLLPRYESLGAENYTRLIHIFFSYTSLAVHGIGYGFLLVGLYRIIKRLRNHVEEKEGGQQ